MALPLPPGFVEVGSLPLPEGFVEERKGPDHSTSLRSAAAAAGTGAASGVVGLPGDVEHLVHAGIGWYKGREAAPNLLPTGGDVDRYLGYDPSTATTAEKYLHGGAAMAAGAAIPLPGSTLASVGRNAALGAAGGLASEAAGQATEGTGLETPARIAAALAAPAGAGRLVNAAENALAARRAVAAGQRTTLPTLDEMQMAGTAANDRFRQSGVSIPGDIVGVSGRVTRSELNDRGLYNFAAPKTDAMLNRIQRDARPTGVDPVTNAPIYPDVEASQLSAYRQNLRKTADEAYTLGPKGFTATQEGAAANFTRRSIDDMIERAAQSDPGMAAAWADLNEGNRNYAGYVRERSLRQGLENADQKAAAEHSGFGFGNKLRQEIKGLLGPKGPGFSAAEEEGLLQAQRGRWFSPTTGLGSNSVRMLSNIMGGGGGIGTHFGAGAVGSVLGSLGGPAGAAVGGALGFGVGPSLRLLANRMTRNDFNRVIEMSARRTPLGQNTFQPTPYQGQGVAGPAMRTLIAMSQGNNGG